MEVMTIRELIAHFENYPRVEVHGKEDFVGAVLVDDNGIHLMEREKQKSTVWIPRDELMEEEVKSWFVDKGNKLIVNV